MRTQSVELTVTVTFRDQFVTGTDVAREVSESPNAQFAMSTLVDKVIEIEGRGGEICGMTFYAQGADNI